MIKKLLSLPPNLVGCFHEITGLSQNEYFCTNDPVGHKLGSGIAFLCTIGQDPDTSSCFSLGAWTTFVTRPSFPAGPSL